MRWVVLAAALAAALAGGMRPAAAEPSERQGSLLWDNRPRSWVLHVPPGEASARRPLVIALHGAGGTGRAFAEETKLGQAAEKRGFLVAFPDGTGAEPARLTWNAGFCCGYAVANNVDDVGFLGRLVDAIDRDTPVDRRRVYLTGMSNGGMLAYRAAAEASERYAAVAPVAAAIGGTNRSGAFWQIPRPSRPVPLLAIHGGRDPYVLFEGGVSPVLGFPLRRNLAVADALRFWSQADGCAGEPIRAELQGAHLVHVAWTRCAAGSEVGLWEIVEAQHWWPADTAFPRETAGDGGTIDGLLLAFFARHTRPE